MGIGSGSGTNTYQPQSQAPPRSGGKGFVDPNNVSMLSIPKQTKFYVDRLRQFSGQSGETIFDYQQMVDVAKAMNL